MYKDIAYQIYSCRNHLKSKEDIEQTFQKIADIGYTQIQTDETFIDGCTCEEFASYINKAGLKGIGHHISMPENPDDIDGILDVAKILGTTNIGLGGVRYPTIEEYLTIIDKINRLAENLAKHGIKFTYHHHSHEFSKIDGVKPMDILMEKLNKNVTFVVDTYWLNNAGFDVIPALKKFAGRVDILHLKDRGLVSGTSTGMITEVGNGNIDFKAVLKTAEEMGIQYICVEQDSWPEDSDSLISAKISFDNLKKIIG